MAAPNFVLQTIIDGARNCVIKANFVSGGADQAQTKIVDVTLLHPPASTSLKIRKIDYNIWPSGTVQLYWDAPANPVHIMDLTGWDHFNFVHFGGLTNNGGPNATGSILIATSGFTLGSNYTIVLEMIKGV